MKRKYKGLLTVELLACVAYLLGFDTDVNDTWQSKINQSAKRWLRTGESFTLIVALDLQ